MAGFARTTGSCIMVAMGVTDPGSASFYEDDEPIDGIRAIVGRRPDGFTREPTARITNVRHFGEPGTNEAFGVRVRRLPTTASVQHSICKP